MQTFHKLVLIISLIFVIYLDISKWKAQNRSKTLSASSFGMSLTSSSMLHGLEPWKSGLNSTLYGNSNDTQSTLEEGSAWCPYRPSKNEWI
jgi:hypothetical protein